MKKKKVLVLGASGFIGHNLFRDFSSRDDLDVYGTYFTNDRTGIDTTNPRLFHVDLTNKDWVETIVNGYDVLIQAAATTSGSKIIKEHPELHVTDNGLMNHLIFRAAHHNNIPHVIYFSCTIMYSFGHTALKETDLDLNRELGDYFGAGWTKVYNEKLCEFYSRLGRTHYTVVRHSNIYGPYDKFDLEKSHVFGAAMNKTLNPKNDKVVIWGDGKEKRDLLYVDDLVEFVGLAMDKQKTVFEIFNVGSGETISVKELYEKMVAHSGRKIELTHDLSKPTFKDSSITIDIGKAKAFGWTPGTSLDEGIRKTMAWYLENLNK